MSFTLEAYLDSFQNWESRLDFAGRASFSLESMDRLLTAFGRPDDKLKFVHVAGSKGKGSTCLYLANILRSAGYRVGLYTSPHLYSVAERIRILEPGESVSPDDFDGMAGWTELEARARYYQDPVDRLRYDEGVPVTCFEYLTALAASWFNRHQVDVVVLETGLGGRLDATNVFETMACGITPVGLEHTHILGATLAAIAREKAGIIKSPCQRVTLAPQPEEAREVLVRHCGALGIVPTEVGKDLGVKLLETGVNGSSFECTGRRQYRGLGTGLIGRHQVMNAAMALAMAEDLEMYGLVLDEEAVERGIARTRWPARFEVFGRFPCIVIDGAHTPESARAAADTFRSVFPGEQAVLVFGAARDKDAAAMARELAEVASSVILTAAAHPRSADPESLMAGQLFGRLPVSVTGNVEEALKEARLKTGRGGAILVCGSLFLCAEARKHVSV